MSTQKMFPNDSLISFVNLKSASNKRSVHEEILIMDDIGLIGSIGGSLGLFVGFSFYGFAMPILETVLDKVTIVLHKLMK